MCIMRPTWRTWAPAGLLAVVGLLDLGAAPARAQFPIFFGGDVLLPDGRKLGTPPGRPRRREDYPVGSSGYAFAPSRPNLVAPQPRPYYAPRTYTYAPQPQAQAYRYPQQAYSYAPQAQTHYAPQARPYYAPQARGYYYAPQPAR